MSLKNLIILEIIYNFPCEVFITRHFSALGEKNFKFQQIARHSDKDLSLSASIGQKKIGTIIMPNFDRMTLVEKINSFRYLILYPEKDNVRTKFRDRVLLSFFASLKPNLIHFHFGSLAVMMDWIPEALGIPYTMSLRGSDVQVSSLMSENYAYKLKETILHASGVHSVCDSLWWEACEICQIPPNQVFHQAIYTTVPISEKPRIKEPDTNVRNHFHFVSIGRFHWSKAFVNLLLAFRHFLDFVGPANLTIVGDGSEKEALLYWINDLDLNAYVRLTGKLQYDEFSKLLMECDALIQSSIAEGFSNVTAEAMGMGVPVFATDVGGTGEIIIEGENGFLLNPHNPQEWWEKLRLVKDKMLMEKIGHNGWVKAKETFSSKRHANEFIKFYQDVINAR